jgi:hypothetical protein
MNYKELIIMADTTSKVKIKRASKGQRTYVRRLKQAARKEEGMNTPHSSPVQPKPVHKKQD